MKTKGAADTRRAAAKDGVCERCGGRLGRDAAAPPDSLAGLAACCFLLILFAIVGYGVYQWIDHRGWVPFDHPSWREPLDDWSS